MATTLAPSTAMDLRRPGTFAVRLGSSALKASDATRYTRIRYNFKPTIKPTATVRISKEDGDSSCRLQIREDAEHYTYRSSEPDHGDEHLYVLVLGGTGEKKGWTLERLHASYGYNLVKTSSKLDQAKVKDHPQLEPEHDDGGDDALSREEYDGADDDPDPDNPYDFRHFLKDDALKSHEPPASVAGTPTVAPARPPTSTPVGKSQRKANAFAPKPAKRKAQPTEKAAPSKRPRPAPVSAGKKTAQTNKPSKSEAPKVRIERKPSLRKSSIIDSGELILENDEGEDEISHVGPKAMSLALNGQLGTGPISLHSAVSSPGSRVGTPEPEDNILPSYEFELGGDSDEEHAPPPGNRTSALDDDDEDADVEDFELPSPAQVHRPSAARKQSVAQRADAAGGDDDDDELQKELELAMAEEEEEESEEE